MNLCPYLCVGHGHWQVTEMIAIVAGSGRAVHSGRGGGSRCSCCVQSEREETRDVAVVVVVVLGRSVVVVRTEDGTQ